MRNRSTKGEAVAALDAAPAYRSLLRPLGIVGYDAVEPALLAALATEEPLLLVSDHGAAKTLLLVRLAEALGLELRHYNASLIQFDSVRRTRRGGCGGSTHRSRGRGRSWAWRG